MCQLRRSFKNRISQIKKFGYEIAQSVRIQESMLLRPQCAIVFRRRTKEVLSEDACWLRLSQGWTTFSDRIVDSLGNWEFQLRGTFELIIKDKKKASSERGVCPSAMCNTERVGIAPDERKCWQ